MIASSVRRNGQPCLPPRPLPHDIMAVANPPPILTLTLHPTITRLCQLSCLTTLPARAILYHLFSIHLWLLLPLFLFHPRLLVLLLPLSTSEPHEPRSGLPFQHLSS